MSPLDPKLSWNEVHAVTLLEPYYLCTAQLSRFSGPRGVSVAEQRVAPITFLAHGRRLELDQFRLG